MLSKTGESVSMLTKPLVQGQPHSLETYSSYSNTSDNTNRSAIELERIDGKLQISLKWDLTMETEGSTDVWALLLVQSSLV